MKFVFSETDENIINNKNFSEIKMYDKFPVFAEFKDFISKKLNGTLVNYDGFTDIYNENNDEKIDSFFNNTTVFNTGNCTLNKLQPGRPQPGR